jgi:nitrite reductase (NADH) small subunit
MDNPPVGTFVTIATLADFRERRSLVRELNGHEIVVFSVAGEYFAVSNVCPHQHVPVIAEGALEGHVVTCPMHGWTYDVRTGRAVNASGGLRTFDLRVEGDALQVRVPEPPPEFAW